MPWYKSKGSYGYKPPKKVITISAKKFLADKAKGVKWRSSKDYTYAVKNSKYKSIYALVSDPKTYLWRD